jgi:hypothetical protein
MSVFLTGILKVERGGSSGYAKKCITTCGATQMIEHVQRFQGWSCQFKLESHPEFEFANFIQLKMH